MAEFEEVVNLKTKTSGAESVKSLKQEIREAQADAVKLSRQFGDFSKEATAAAKRVANLRDEMGDFQQRVAALNPDRFQAIASLTQGIAGGISAATGAMALFGGESEEVQQALVKVQGAIAFSQGVQQIMDLRNSFGAVATVIKAQVVTAFTTLKGAIAATGIGALIIGIGLLIAKLNELSEAEKEAARNQALLDAAAADEAVIRNRRLERELAELKRISDEKGKLQDEQLAKNKQFYAERLKQEQEFQSAMEEAVAESEKIEQTGVEAAKKNADELEAIRQGARVAEQRQLQNWFEEQEAIYNASGQSLEDLIILRNEKSAAIDDKYYQEQKQKDEAKAAETIALKKKTDDELVKQEAATQAAMVQARQAGLDSTSQLLGALASNYATWQKENRDLAIAQVLVDEAKAIAATIAGATQAAAAGGPAAPFLVGAYIASGLATVAANFKRVKDILKSYETANTPPASTAPGFNPINSSFLPGSDEVAGSMRDMRVYVLEGDITRTQGKQQRNRNVSVI